MPCKPKKNKRKKYNIGGNINGPSHEQGGVVIEAEGGEYIVNESINGAATKHSKGLKNLNKNPDDYVIVPITDSRNNFVLEFIDYTIDPPRYSIEECIDRGLTFKVPLKVKLKLYY